MAPTNIMRNFTWMTKPFIIGAPMRIMSGPRLACAISQGGGLGFIGPGASPDDSLSDLAAAKASLASSPLTSVSDDSMLPVGIGFQIWNGDIVSATRAVQEHRPCAAWLFAPRNGQDELDEWASHLRAASPGIQIWLQIGTLQEALEAAKSSSRPDVIVVQGAEVGGHGIAQGSLGLMTMFPEIADAVRSFDIPLFAAGGIADGRGIAAALSLGAAGVVLGTRFLASTEARIQDGYRKEIVRASDGATNTVRTTLYNQLRGTKGWPEQYSPRGIVNDSWHDHRAGVGFEKLKELHDEALRAGDSEWGPQGRLATYAGAAVGLIHDVQPAEQLVRSLQAEARAIIKDLSISPMLSSSKL